jgi:hypothetical protein
VPILVASRLHSIISCVSVAYFVTAVCNSGLVNQYSFELYACIF